jgi:hypothetical protein
VIARSALGGGDGRLDWPGGYPADSPSVCAVCSLPSSLPPSRSAPPVARLPVPATPAAQSPAVSPAPTAPPAPKPQQFHQPQESGPHVREPRRVHFDSLHHLRNRSAHRTLQEVAAYRPTRSSTALGTQSSTPHSKRRAVPHTSTLQRTYPKRSAQRFFAVLKIMVDSGAGALGGETTLALRT